MPNCDEDINKAFRKIFWNVVEASGDEVRFAAFSQQVQQFEREVAQILAFRTSMNSMARSR